MEDLLYVVNHFSLADFDILFFVFVFQKFYYNVFQCGYLWVHLTWSLSSFLDVYVYVFHQIWGVYSHYIFNILFTPLPFMGLPQYICWFSWWCPTVPVSLHFSSILFFSFCPSDLYFPLSRFLICWFFLLPIQFCLCIPQMNFHFSYYTFQLQNFILFLHFLFL